MIWSVYIPSLDRACQLDFLLSSINRFVPHFFDKIYIHYAASALEFEQAYDKLKLRFPQYEYYYENDQRRRLDKFIEIESDFCGIICDDNVFYRKPDFAREDIENSWSEQTFSWSFRLGLNCSLVSVYNNEEQQPPDSLENLPNFIRWNWLKSTGHMRWGAALDGNFYRCKDFQELSRKACGGSFNEWECRSNDILSADYQHKPLMFSPKQSCLVNIPVNRAENGHSPAGLIHSYNRKELNDKYLGGEVLDFDVMDWTVNCCQIEKEFKFKKE